MVEFPAGVSTFTGEVAQELASLVDRGIVRVLDWLIIHKNEDGSYEAHEFDDLEKVDELRQIEAELAEILAEDDVLNLAASMENGSTAGVLVWENLWAEHIRQAIADSGGVLVERGQIPAEVVEQVKQDFAAEE